MSFKPIQVLGVPVDSNSSYMTGSALAPQHIREAFFCDSANLSTETGFDLGDERLWHDLGDINLHQLDNQQAFDTILATAKKQVAEHKHILSIGGDHSVSFPLISAYAEAFPGLNILHFDAHPDLYDNMQDNPFSHASPFARLMETGQVKRLVQVGIRTLNNHQKQQAQRFGVEQHTMRDLSGVDGLKFDGPVYLSIDLDALDPAYAPGVSHHEPGGLSTRFLLDVIHTFKGQLIGADIVELNPHRDINSMTAMVAAKLAKEVIGRMLLDQSINP
ncbi:agmatinase [Marinomonas agarivorans]|nr:agmatinase [Marinomonas agarivorans]